MLAPVSTKAFMGSPFIETLMVFFSTGMMTLTFLGDELCLAFSIDKHLVFVSTMGMSYGKLLGFVVYLEGAYPC